MRNIILLMFATELAPFTMIPLIIIFGIPVLIMISFIMSIADLIFSLLFYMTLYSLEGLLIFYIVRFIFSSIYKITIANKNNLYKIKKLSESDNEIKSIFFSTIIIVFANKYRNKIVIFISSVYPLYKFIIYL